MPRSSSFRDELVDSLGSQIEALSKEVAVLRRSMAKHGRSAYAGATDTAETLLEDLTQRWSDALPHMRKGARTVERQAKDNPAAAAAVGLAVVGLLTLLVLKRR